MCCTRTKVSAVAIAIGVLVALSAGVAMRASWERPAEPAAAALLDTPESIHWPEARRQVYRVHFENRDEGRLVATGGPGNASGETLRSVLSLDGLVAVTGDGSGEASGTTRVTFEVLACERASWEIAGVAAWASAIDCTTALTGARLGADVSPRGLTSALYAPAGADEVTQGVLQALWLRMQFALPGVDLSAGATYRVEEAGLQGTARQGYVVRSGDGPDERLRLERSTEALEDVRAASGLREPPVVSVAGSASAVIARSGRLARVAGEEQLDVRSRSGVPVLSSNTSFRFEWLREEAVAPSGLAKPIRRATDQMFVSAATDARLLDQRIDGLDAETLTSMLRTYGSGGHLSDMERFLWRATGLLEKRPDASRELLAIYRSPGATPALRALVMDLLASSGHAQAQTAMRAALGDGSLLVSGDAEDRRLYQRVGLLDHPTRETAEMVAHHYHELRGRDDVEARLTTAYALGAVIRGLRSGDDDARALAAAYGAELARDLRATRDPVELAHMVTAVANTRDESNMGVLADLAEHPSREVRSRVAHALGRVASRPPDALLGLLADEDRGVQRTAVRAAPLHEETYRALTLNTALGLVAEPSVRPILDLVRKGRASHRADTDALLDALIERGIRDDQERELAFMLREM